jgi:SAM-dependent methyltransferase
VKERSGSLNMPGTEMPQTFSFREGRYYRFGLHAGLANLFHNGCVLGIKKTLGKIFQPVNFYGRFPEYYFFERGLEPLWQRSPARREIRILDVGSPKLFGIYLAFHYPVEVWLTDIHPLNIDEYRVLWAALSKKAIGDVVFAIQDGRRLSFPDRMFDGVFAMSVVEHIAGDAGDSLVCAEMMRVLRPGGRLCVSVPFGPTYMEQRIRGLKGAVERTKDGRTYFFERIYDHASFRKRICEALQSDLVEQQLITVFRRRLVLVKMIHWLRGRLGENVMGFLGFANPLLSKLCNMAETGAKKDFFAHYTPIHDATHIYADLIWAAKKSPGN